MDKIIAILEKVYTHGKRNSTQVLDLPKDELTIEEAHQAILDLLPSKKNCTTNQRLIAENGGLKWTSSRRKMIWKSF